MAGPTTDVFISYKAEERKRLAPLVDALEAEGFTVWWDQNISGGANWREEIEAHLDAAKVVIVVWSKRTIGPEGRFVRDEAGQAQEAGHYLPITIDNVRPPLGFREVQALDLSSWWGKRDDPRFKVLADTIRARLEGKEIRHHLVLPRGPVVSRRTAIAGGVGAGALAAVGVGGWLLLKPGEAEAKRIAVLPFANLSGSADQAYFAEGIAEELRSALSRVGMEVIGRASSDAVKEMETKEAASKLGVAHMLTGSVRRSATTVRINAQLVGGKDGVERWAQSYDRAPGDEIKIQTDIASHVAQALSVALGQAGQAALTLGGTADAVAQDLVLRARRAIRTAVVRDDVMQSLALTEAAIRRDPDYADAHRVKSRALELLGSSFPESSADMAIKLVQAKASAERAIQLEPGLGSAYLALALVEQARFEFAGAARNMQRGLALSPNDPVVVSAASTLMQSFASPERAITLARRALALEPMHAGSHERLSQSLQARRDFAEAIASSRRALELDPTYVSSLQSIGTCLMLTNRFAEAKAALERMPQGDPFRIVQEGILAARMGNRAGAEKVIAALKGDFGDAASYQYAQIYIHLGDFDRAFAEFDNAVRVKDPGLLSLKSDPILEPIVRDPRYTALLKRLRFPTWT